MLLTLITVNLNSGYGLEKTFNSYEGLIKDGRVQSILIDGLSSDGSVMRLGSRVLSYSISISEKDAGIYDAMNKGLALSAGSWVWFLNSGDLCMSLCPEELLGYLEDASTRTNLIYSDFYVGNLVKIRQKFSPATLIRGMINHQSIVYKRSLLVDGFDARYKYAADFAHLLKNYKFINAMKIPNPLIHYDLNGFSSQLTRLARFRVWSERGRAFSESSIRIDLKVFGIVISYSLCILKFIFPRLGSRTLNFLNNIR
jgi:hypothetical protein